MPNAARHQAKAIILILSERLKSELTRAWHSYPNRIKNDGFHVIPKSQPRHPDTGKRPASCTTSVYVKSFKELLISMLNRTAPEKRMQRYTLSGKQQKHNGENITTLTFV